MLKTKHLPGIFLLALMWGPSFLLIKLSIADFHPITATFIRCFSAFVTVVIYCMLKRIKPYLYLKDWKKLILSSLYLMALPFLLCSVGEMRIDSSTAGIIEGFVPVLTLLLARFAFRNKDIHKRQVIGIIIGFLGLIITFAPTIQSQNMNDILGFLSIITMTFFFGFGFLYSEKHLSHIPFVESTALHTLFASLALLPFSLIFDPWVSIGTPSLVSIISVLTLGVVSTSAGWLVYFFVLKQTGAKNISIATLMCPIFALIIGRFIANEPITTEKILGSFIILFSVFFMSELYTDLKAFFIRRKIKPNSTPK